MPIGRGSSAKFFHTSGKYSQQVTVRLKDSCNYLQGEKSPVLVTVRVQLLETRTTSPPLPIPTASNLMVNVEPTRAKPVFSASPKVPRPLHPAVLPPGSWGSTT